MTVAFGIRPITIQDFVGRLEDRLKDKSGLAQDCVFLSLAADEDHIKMPPADRFVAIFPARFPPWQGVVTGAGRPGSDSNLGFDVAFRTTVYCRLINDEETRASRTLRDDSVGILKTTLQVVSALQMWTMPTDPDADPLVVPTYSYLREPMRVVGSGPELVTKRTPSNVWVLSWTMWEARLSVLLSDV